MKKLLSLVLAITIIICAVPFGAFTFNASAASCEDDLSKLNVVYANGGINQTAPTRGTGSETDPYIIENPSHLRYIAQLSTFETTNGKYYKVDDNVDIMVFQSEAYINAVAGSLAEFLALDAEGTKAALSNTENRIQYQSGSTAADYDSFAGTIDFNGVTICGIYYNAKGGLLSVVNGGTTLKNLTLCNNYYSSTWYNGNLVGFVHNGTAGNAEYRPLTISNIVIHDCYQYTTGNGYSNTGVLVGTGVSSKNIPFHISNILTYDNISLGHTSGSDTTENACALYGMLPSSWNGESDGVANASFSNIVTLDCVPYPTQTINNQCTKPDYWSRVYTAKVDAQDREPCFWYQEGDQWNKFDITVLSSADLALGAAAKTNMPGLDWVNTWITVDGAYPELQSMHSFAADDNGDGTHTTKCADCGAGYAAVAHTFVDNVCACGYEAKCGEVVLYWDGSADSTLADNGEAGTADNPIIIDSAAELNYLANSVTGASAAGKLYYKMADGIDKVVLQPKGVLDLDALLACADGAAVKAYFETVGTENLKNWAETNGSFTTFFAGTFDGNGTQFVGMYVYDGSAGLFITADGGATFKNLAVTHSYIYGSKNRVDGYTNGQCYTGAIVGWTSGVNYGAKVQGTVSFDNVLVADNYIRSDRFIGTIGLVMGCGIDEVAAINNAIVYGNDASCAESPDSKPYLFIAMGVEGVSHSTVSNSIVLGGTPYNYYCNAAEYFTNVYTDADTTGYEEANIKSVAGLAGAELKEACAALDWTNTFLATDDMPTFRSMHNELTAIDNGTYTHTESCNCGFKTTMPHTFGTDNVCDICGYVCTHNGGKNFAERFAATCTEAAKGDFKCAVCNVVLEENLYNGVPLDHIYKNACDTTCNECGATRTVPSHVYTHACDTTCNECGYIRNVQHTFVSGVCNVCGLKQFPVAIRISATSVTLAPYTNYEFSLDGISWQKDNHFEGLKANTQYSFYQRIAETAHTNASAASAACNVITSAKSACSVSPAAPIVAETSTSKVVLVAREGYEYSKNGTAWQTSNIFTGLSSNTNYTFYQRIKETDTNKASAASVGTTVRTNSIDNTGTTSATNYTILRNYIDAYGTTGSDGCKNIVRSKTSSNGYTFYFGLKNTSTGIKFQVVTDSSNYSKMVGVTEFVLMSSSKYISVYSSMLAYSGSSVLDAVDGTKSIDRSTYYAGRQYALSDKGTYLTASDFSTHFSDTLNVLCSLWDAEIYSILGFGLSGLGFTSYGGNGTTVCDIPSNYHKGGTEKRNDRVATCTTDGYTGDTYCTNCGEKRSAGSVVSCRGYHTYDNDCDVYCNTCNEGRIINHTYANACDTSCNICGNEREATVHTYDTICDSDCNECGLTKTVLHIFDNKDDMNCNVCGATRTIECHLYDNNCDTTCNLCGDIRSITHTYTNACDTSCNVCGATRTPSAHVYDHIYDTHCNVCGAVREATPLEWEISVTKTGVYTLKPNSKYTGSFSINKIIVSDKNGNAVKYNESKGGFPLVADQDYIVKFNYDCIDDINGTVTWTKTQKSNTIFTDVSSSQWYNDAVTYSVGRGIISGYGGTTKFGPGDNIQRQDFLVILARLDGVDLTSYGNKKSAFPDVPEGSYYEAAVNWGVEKGIVSGYQNGKFGTGDKITREQLVTFLYRYANYKGLNTSYTTTQKNNVKNTYTDYKNVTDYAVNPVIWAVTYGVINGKTPTTIVPHGNALRCEVAQIMYNIFKNNIF